MRGFFSTVVVGMAVILLIAIFYAQQSQVISEQESVRSLIVQQSLSKEWSLARQAYSQFASDAIAEALDAQLNGPFSVATCPNGPVGADFSAAIAVRWNDVNLFLQQNLDVNCHAVISPSLESSACGLACSPYGDVISGQDVLVSLTCSKQASNGGLHQLSFPFTLNKLISLNWDAPSSSCRAIVSDNMASPPIVEVSHVLT